MCRARHPGLRVAVVAGLGAFIGAAAARRAGCEVRLLAGAIGDDSARYAPAAAVALLWNSASMRSAGHIPAAPATVAVADIVVKVGGSLVAHPDALRAILSVVESASRTRRLVVVPGGGPMADAVRAVDRAVGLPDAAAHWMAVMAMDQYGEALASHMARSRVVHDRDGIGQAIDAGDVPVLAPACVAAAARSAAARLVGDERQHRGVGGGRGGRLAARAGQSAWCGGRAGG